MWAYYCNIRVYSCDQPAAVDEEVPGMYFGRGENGWGGVEVEQERRVRVFFSRLCCAQH